MRLFRLRRFAVAFWLGLLALTASGIAQNQLSANVLVAALEGHDHRGHQAAAGQGEHYQGEHYQGGHYMPDGTFMAGAMPGMDHADASNTDASRADASQNGGHTHKGHSDCTMCSAVAAMAGLTAAVIVVLSAPQVQAASAGWTAVDAFAPTVSPAFYSSRAPPVVFVAA